MRKQNVLNEAIELIGEYRFESYQLGINGADRHTRRIPKYHARGICEITAKITGVSQADIWEQGEQRMNELINDWTNGLREA